MNKTIDQVIKIEETRIQLNKLVVKKRFNLQDSEVLLLSKKLDCLILKCQKANCFLNSECIIQ